MSDSFCSRSWLLARLHDSCGSTVSFWLLARLHARLLKEYSVTATAAVKNSYGLSCSALHWACQQVIELAPSGSLLAGLVPLRRAELCQDLPLPWLFLAKLIGPCAGLSMGNPLEAEDSVSFYFPLDGYFAQVCLLCRVHHRPALAPLPLLAFHQNFMRFCLAEVGLLREYITVREDGLGPLVVFLFLVPVSEVGLLLWMPDS